MNRFALEDAIAARFQNYIINDLNGYDMKRIIRKKLYASDISKTQSRLSMPMKQLETHEFLTDYEKQELENEKEFPVRLLGPSMRMHNTSMMLKIWKLSSTSSYVLKDNWNDFVKENDEVLKVDANICVWSFRVEGMLCFALACMDDVA